MIFMLRIVVVEIIISGWVLTGTDSVYAMELLVQNLDLLKFCRELRTVLSPVETAVAITWIRVSDLTPQESLGG